MLLAIASHSEAGCRLQRRLTVDLVCRWWVVGGLGARGLVYHAWLGEHLAQAVLAREESLLPAELRRWQ